MDFRQDIETLARHGLREEFKSIGHLLSGQGHAAGLIIVACSHFLRSKDSSKNSKHPEFPEFLKHWLYSMKNGNVPLDKVQVDELIAEYGLPENPKIVPGKSYWDDGMGTDQNVY